MKITKTINVVICDICFKEVNYVDGYTEIRKKGVKTKQHCSKCRSKLEEGLSDE